MVLFSLDPCNFQCPRDIEICRLKYVDVFHGLMLAAVCLTCMQPEQPAEEVSRDSSKQDADAEAQQVLSERNLCCALRLLALDTQISR